jgi:DeoR/GlpR family transcriptional regulator of sugar metabolism
MLTAERRRQILDILTTDERAEVAALAIRFTVSESTIRRDLEWLSRSGAVERIRGGAVPALRVEPSYEQKRRSHEVEKRAIARAAARLVEPGGSILLDAGTTTLAVARALRGIRDLTVATTSLPIALELVDRARVIVVGGMLRERTVALVGPLAERTVDQLHVDVAFVGTNGVAVGAGFTTPTWEEASIKARMIGAATTSVVVADGSKLGEITFAKICGLEEVDLLVTDRSAPVGELAALRTAGLRIDVAAPEEGADSPASDDGAEVA